MLCANCGIEDGTPKHGQRGSVSLSLADWIPGLGLVLWCSESCHDQWRQDQRDLPAPHLETAA